MASRAARRASLKGPSEEESRKFFCEMFVQAVENSGASINAISLWVNRSAVTVRGWLAGTHRINQEALRRSPLIWSHFARCMMISERKARRV